MRFDAVFFDSGGTLYGRGGDGDPTPAQVEAGRVRRVEAALNGFDVEVAYDLLERRLRVCEEECKERLGAAYNFYRLMTVLCEDLELDLGPEEAACLADAYAGPRYASWLFPGTLDVIRRFSERGIYLGVIANTVWPGFCMDRAFAGVGLLPYFKTRVYSGDLGVAKPDARIFHLTEAISGLKGKRILFVGNNLKADIQGASGVGWATAFRKNGGRSGEGLADFEFEETTELPGIVLGDD
jgi:FMN phosphatase YigB (HAD superfamily)